MFRVRYSSYYIELRTIHHLFYKNTFRELNPYNFKEIKVLTSFSIISFHDFVFMTL